MIDQTGAPEFRGLLDYLELSADDQLRWATARAGCNCLLPMARQPDGRWATTEQEVAQALSAEQAAAQEAMLVVAQNEKG